MTNEFPIAHGQGTRTGEPTRHPAGDIRLPAPAAVGRRAQLLAGLDELSCDMTTLVETSFSLSWN